MQSPQMIQAMQILQLSALELSERIEQELTENPFLEIKEVGEGEGGDGSENGEGVSPELGVALDGMVDTLAGRGERDLGPRQRVSSEESDKKQEAMNNTPSQYHSLGDALLDQIALSDFDERRRTIAELLVYSLDQRGYLPEPLEKLVESSEIEGLTVAELTEVLAELRVATHPALGARDLRECLLLQLEPLGLDSPLLLTLIADHLEDITTNRLPHVARVTGKSLDDVKLSIETIRMLDPNPGRDYGQSPAETIRPDVVVEEIDGRYEVRLTRQGLPDLTLSPAYKELLRRAGGAESAKKWVKQKLENARWFIEAVQQRQSTLLRISRAVFERQQDFLDKGIKSLAPLRMLEIADATSVHISTVSRAVAGKYVQTPHGIIRLRDFFSGGTQNSSGDMLSQASVKQRIKELVEKEDTKEPLSDDKLAELLEEKHGIKIARRTITKYRKALGIAASTQRKVF